jgi:hypothetical protein
MMRTCPVLLLASWMAVTISVAAQQEPGTPKKPPEEPEELELAANPGRPTIATPATLTPVGYFQFETGYLGAWRSPEFSSQTSFNEVVKFSLTRWVELIAEAGPFASSVVQNQTGNGAGGLALGLQGVIYHGEAARPTIALSYFRQVYGGDTPDLDIGSATNSFLFLASADLRGFHYDANFFFNEVVDSTIHRAQFGQTLSVSHALGKKWGLSGEIWHFTQPALRSDAVANLWTLNYNVRKNFVLDGGFNHGLTSTSTQWEVFFGFTYLLPHRVARGNHVKNEARKESLQIARGRRDRMSW